MFDLNVIVAMNNRAAAKERAERIARDEAEKEQTPKTPAVTEFVLPERQAG